MDGPGQRSNWRRTRYGDTDSTPPTLSTPRKDYCFLRSKMPRRKKAAGFSGTGPCPHQHARLSHRRCKAAFAVRREWQPPEQQPPMPMPIGLLHARDALQLAPAQARAAHALSGATKAHGCASPRQAFCEICGTRSRFNYVLYILYSRPMYISETISCHIAPYRIVDMREMQLKTRHLGRWPLLPHHGQGQGPRALFQGRLL